jgi:two-component system, chemotaxis family, response regulator Rcp1
MSDPLRILLVEDNPADARLLQEAFAELRFGAELAVVRDGVQALKRLRGGALPDVVLLDLNLPIMDGRELLDAIRNDPTLGELPVVVLSTSHYDQDIATCRRLGARGYVIKPPGYAELLEAAAGVMRLCEECRA